MLVHRDISTCLPSWIFHHEIHECLMDPDPPLSQDCASSLLEGGGWVTSALGINDND